MTEDVDLKIVTLSFEASDPQALAGVLSRYVVLSRGQAGCRNIDLCASVLTPNRFLLIEKWESAEAQRAHFDSPEMIEMAQSCDGLLTRQPDIDLYQGLSAYDLE